jgi:hypothetical protein
VKKKWCKEPVILTKKIAIIPEEGNWNESLSRGVSSEKKTMRTVENEDYNSDITAKISK